MISCVDSLRKNIFEQNSKQIVEDIIGCLEKFSEYIAYFNEEQLREYSLIMQKIDEFFKLGDYLSVSDVMLFDMLPLIEKVRGNDRVLQ